MTSMCNQHSGQLTFNPTLESGLRTNVVGTQNVIAFAKRMKRPALIHVSTCFVAGTVPGQSSKMIRSSVTSPRVELKDFEFSVEQEIADCAKLAERAREKQRRHDGRLLSRPGGKL